MAVLKLVDWINDAYEAGLIPAAEFLNMRKTFNMVDHTDLIQALALIGVKGSSLEWLSSYLHNWYQIVKEWIIFIFKKEN